MLIKTYMEKACNVVIFLGSSVLQDVTVALAPYSPRTKKKKQKGISEGFQTAGMTVVCILLSRETLRSVPFPCVPKLDEHDGAIKIIDSLPS